MQIQENAIFISDVHYCKKREEFLDFLSWLEKDENLPPQLFLLGDIFELLFGNISMSQKSDLNLKVINLLVKLSQKIEIIYFEGNHDFNLKAIFQDKPNIKIFTIEEQPQIFEFKNKKIMISHGDFDQKNSYFYYRRIISKKLTLKTLNIVNFLFRKKIFQKIIDSKEKVTLDKMCWKNSKFREYVKNRIIKIDLQNIDYFIDGHFHQGVNFDFDEIKYINLPAFVCSKKFLKIGFKDKKIQFETLRNS